MKLSTSGAKGRRFESYRAYHPSIENEALAASDPTDGSGATPLNPPIPADSDSQLTRASKLPAISARVGLARADCSVLDAERRSLLFRNADLQARWNLISLAEACHDSGNLAAAASLLNAEEYLRARLSYILRRIDAEASR